MPCRYEGGIDFARGPRALGIPGPPERKRYRGDSMFHMRVRMEAGKTMTTILVLTAALLIAEFIAQGHGQRAGLVTPSKPARRRQWVSLRASAVPP